MLNQQVYLVPNSLGKFFLLPRSNINIKLFTCTPVRFAGKRRDFHVPPWSSLVSKVLIGNNIENEIISVSKSSKLSQNDDANNDLEIPKERYISPEKNTTNYWRSKTSII